MNYQSACYVGEQEMLKQQVTAPYTSLQVKNLFLVSGNLILPTFKDLFPFLILLLKLCNIMLELAVRFYLPSVIQGYGVKKNTSMSR